MVGRKWLMILMGLLFSIFMMNQALADRTAGEILDDSVITTKVNALLFEDDFVSGLDVSVNTYAGEVTLTGGVENVDQKQRAEEIARSVDGVVGVNNLLNISDQ
ncbi:BON domain-containing protein [Desulfonatronum parangueonense]